MKITLRNLSFHAYHGVEREERKLGQRFEVDVELSGDFQKAALTDSLQESVDYSQVYALVKKVMEGGPCSLLETLAERLCRLILSGFPRVVQVTVRVRKPEVPLPGILDYVEVEWTGMRHP